MKFYKRITLLLVCLALTLSLFSCSELKKDADSSAPQGSTEVPDGSDAPAELGSSNDLMTGISPTAVTARTPDERFINSTADFAFKIFKESSASSEENTLVSPLSVLLALAITANGAEGETKAQMEALIGGEIPMQELNEYLKTFAEALYSGEGAKLSVANSIWFRETGFIPNEDFLRTNANYYNASAYKAPFDDSTLKDINAWVSAKTDGLIENILDKIPEAAVMYLINALVFDAEWKAPYESYSVFNGKFKKEDGTEQSVEMMSSDENRFIETDNAKGFVKPYKEGYSFVALLPNEGLGIDSYVADLAGESFVSAIKNAKTQSVYTVLPKFSFEYDIEMKSVLESLGMTDAFSASKADLSSLGTCPEGNIYLSRVIHKTFIEVDEEGTKAAAATVIEAVTEGCIVYENEVILDRPFVFAIIDNNTSLPVFLGTVKDIAE